MDRAASRLSSAGQDAYHFRPACTRSEGGVEVTRAVPGRRFVDLAATHFGDRGYVSSICNANWGEAMGGIAAMIAGRIGKVCVEEPMLWSSSTKTALCEVIVELLDDECPAEFMDGDPQVVEREVEDGQTETSVLCRLPKLQAPLDCAQVDRAKMAEELGWYYCENHAAHAPDARENEIRLTPRAKEAVSGYRVGVECPPEAVGPNPNCREDTAAMCGDGEDNDLDGRFDCDDVYEGSAFGRRHFADPDCCPMEKAENGACVDVDTSLCGRVSDACVSMAHALGCVLGEGTS